jgi:hypothetical protein
MTFLLHLASMPVYGFVYSWSFSGERIYVEESFPYIIWARAGRHGTHLLDDRETGLESLPCLAGWRAAALWGRVRTYAAAAGVIESCHR